jgi:hypothetical protein
MHPLFFPQPRQFYLDDLIAMSKSLGVFIQVIPEGIELIPPTQNVESLGLSPGLKEAKQHLSYLYEKDWMEEEEKEFAKELHATWIAWQ